MNRIGRLLIAALVGLATAWMVGSLVRSPAQEKAPAGAREVSKQDSPEASAVRKTAEEYVQAFNKGDARTAASFWTKDGEYVGPDGEAVHGRDAMEKSYTQFFKEHPKATLEVHIDSLRVLGRHTALEEGRLTLRLPGEKAPEVSRYSALHVREDDGWKLASVREWVPDPAELVSLKDVEWLIGEWTAKSDQVEARMTYAWDEDKAFLRGRYSVKRDGKVAASGTQVLGKNPTGGLRSWQFDSSGGFGEWLWTHEGGRWVIEAAGTLPDGSSVTALNLLIPLGKDAFTWQSVERTAAGAVLPDTQPVKVTRVQAEK